MSALPTGAARAPDAARPPGTRHAPPIAAHRLLGDGAATALLRPGGEVDWWCAPHMDSPPLLWSLLDADGAAARWRGARAASASGRPAGSALSSVLMTARGRVECLDGLHRTDGGPSVLVRLVRGVDEALELEHELALGGFDQPWAAWNGDTAAFGDASGVAGLRVQVYGGSGAGGGLQGLDVGGADVARRWRRDVVRAPRGEWAGLAVTLDVSLDAVRYAAQPDGAGGGARWWRERLLQDVAHDDALVATARLPRRGRRRCEDALRVLQLCTDARTGAVVAAPTTSLPEAPGHDRQFDYRYTWLRDASLAVSVASLLGQQSVADRYLRFVVRQTASRVLPSGPMTDLRGEQVPPEREVPGVAGWDGSLPVRVGNGAAKQRQYDALGLLVEAVSVSLQCGGDLDDDVWELVRSVADALSDDGLDRSTSGIWELREPRDLVSADIGVWLALDRALWIARFWRPTSRRRHWRRARAAAKARVVAALQDDGGLPQAYGDGPRSADASALMAVVFRMFDRRDPRASRLVDATLARLDAAPYLYRYEPGGDDGFGGREGAFVPTSWWVVSALAACGRLAEAEARAEHLDRVLPALMPEEVDPESRQGLGNVPLVWSHMEAARAMHLLDSARVRARWTLAGLAVQRTVRYIASRRSG